MSEEKKKEVEKAKKDYLDLILSTASRSMNMEESDMNLLKEKRNIVNQKYSEYYALLREELGEERYNEYQEAINKKVAEFWKNYRAKPSKATPSYKREEPPKSIKFIKIFIGKFINYSGCHRIPKLGTKSGRGLKNTSSSPSEGKLGSSSTASTIFSSLVN